MSISPSRGRPQCRPSDMPRLISGVLLLHKDIGVSSNRALQLTKRLFNAKKAGHTGSLDPLASGVLPICFGEATKFSRFLLEADKIYTVTAKLGIVTSTADAEGEIIAQNPVPVFSRETILAAVSSFLGSGTQIPSMYSALKHNGQPLYKLARQNITIEREARAIFIYNFDLLDQTPDTLSFSVKCSKGTYIRNLIEDLGTKLGCGAHVVKLERTQAGPFTIDQTFSLEQLQNMQDIESLILPLDCLLYGLPKIQLSAEDAAYFSHGHRIAAPLGLSSGLVSLATKEGVFLGIGEAENDGGIVARRLTAPATLSLPPSKGAELR